MNYAWVETSLMALIIASAVLFAIKHFLPDLYGNAWRFFAGKGCRTIEIDLVAAGRAGSCQTKCTACNGCVTAK
jgi:hypothetical protein